MSDEEDDEEELKTPGGSPPREELIVAALEEHGVLALAWKIARAHGQELEDLFRRPGLNSQPRPRARAEIAHQLHTDGMTWDLVAQIFGVNEGALRALCRRHRFTARRPATHDELVEQLVASEREVLRLRRILADLARMAGNT